MLLFNCIIVIYKRVVIVSGINKNIEKIIEEFDKIGELPKAILRYGIQFHIMLLAIGTLLVILNRHFFSFDYHVEFIAINLVKTSFTVLAEVVIGSLLIDYISKRL